MGIEKQHQVWTFVKHFTRWDGPIAQPTFQPVALNVLPLLDSVKVRSYMPGSEAKWRCGLFSVSKIMCSYTSSVMTMRFGNFATISLIRSISLREKIFPVGL